ncbi:MAG: hypothetical protein JST38_12385 [Bacteroidetes bacterium]|nr:hypothetical protein [Bacteroidota bacterium]MBS1941663.1 hypothetical protein [Bacteroidota bacterium]
MKQVLLFAVIFGLPMSASAQQSWPDTTHRHEVGIDVSSFLWLYSGRAVSDSSSPWMLPAPYWVAYRYHFRNHWALRIGIGGFAMKDERPLFGYSDPLTYTTKQSEVDVRIGLERGQDLAKRWQVIYGLDLRPAWTYQYTDYQYSNGYYRHGEEDHGTDLAGAVLLGIRYRITPRFSLLTEASLAVVATHREQRQFTEPMDADHVPQPDVSISTNSIHTLFQPPLNITASFAL